jgi:hypothetical protein
MTNTNTKVFKIIHGDSQHRVHTLNVTLTRQPDRQTALITWTERDDNMLFKNGTTRVEFPIDADISNIVSQLQRSLNILTNKQ